MDSQLLPKFKEKATMRKATSETQMSGLLSEWIPRYSMARLHREPLDNEDRSILGDHNWEVTFHTLSICVLADPMFLPRMTKSSHRSLLL